MLNLQIRDAAEEAISRTTPRSVTALRLCDSIAIYVAVAFIPLTLSFLISLGFSAVSSNRGRLDLGFALSALVFGAVITLIGEATARFVRLKLLAVLVSFAVGTVIGTYAIVVEGSINNWDSFDFQNYLSTLPWLVLLLIIKILLDNEHLWREHFFKPSLVTVVALFALSFYMFSPAPLYKDRVALTGEYQCVNLHGHNACVWKESTYKIPSMESQLERGTELLAELGEASPRFIVAEPGLEFIARKLTTSEFEVVSLPYHSGDAQSWVAAQMIALDLFERIGFHNHGCPADSPIGWMLLDIVTNYIYGDIAFSDFASEDPTLDRKVQEIGASWKDLSDSDLVTRIGAALDEYAQTCEVKELG